jgi:hypothetical protein
LFPTLKLGIDKLASVTRGSLRNDPHLHDMEEGGCTRTQFRNVAKSSVEDTYCYLLINIEAKHWVFGQRESVHTDGARVVAAPRVMPFCAILRGVEYHRHANNDGLLDKPDRWAVRNSMRWRGVALPGSSCIDGSFVRRSS